MRRVLLAALLLVPVAALYGADGDTAGTQPVPAPESAKDGAANAVGPEDHPVGPEDLLEISVFEIPDLSRTVRVSAKGTISLPLLGEMRVDGLTSMQLETKLRDELTKRYLQDPQVSVFVREYGSKKVSVIGAVGKPGVYEMLGSRTLLEILSQAGGLTPQAGAELYVIRPGKDGTGGEKLTVSVNDLMISRNPALNLAIQPGDIISAPNDRPSYVYVDGAVKTPGRIEQLASRPISLLQAVAKAGGTTDRANLKGVQILRQQAGGTQTVMQTNLKRIRQGKDPDPILQDGDVVVVQETFF
jgi:polysaccharide export outer membrane protein